LSSEKTTKETGLFLMAVLRFATDVTKDKLRNADFEGQIGAIRKSQAVITFEPNSMVVLDANENFCTAMGYTREEVR
jgi:methyl-accepting chemotaxis protein